MKAKFDIAAESYDNDFTNSPIGRMQRNRVWKYLDEQLINKEELNILELNCGTGEDAIRLAKRGNKVLATDISEAMLKSARSKEGSNHVKFLSLDINEIENHSFPTDFDLVFSNFGGLNCLETSTVSKLGRIVSKVLRDNGKFIAVIMPNRCIWESFYFTLKGDLKNAFRRNKEFAIANVSGESVKTYYYSPSGFSALLGDYFRKEILKPIGFFIPPSYLESFFIKHPRMLNILNWLDRWFAVFPWQASFSDHYYIQYIKK